MSDAPIQSNTVDLGNLKFTLPLVMAIGLGVGIATQSYFYGMWRSVVDTTLATHSNRLNEGDKSAEADHDILIDILGRTRRLEQDIAEIKDLLRSKR